MATIVTRFYLDSDFIPNEVSLQHKPLNENELISWLRTKSKHNIRFNYPQRAKKPKKLDNLSKCKTSLRRMGFKATTKN